jgi:penicillin-binding protein 2
MYKQRIKVFLGLMAAVFLLLVGKLVQLQVIEGKQYRLKAEEAMRKVNILPVMRGKITDRKGRILAMDEPCFDLCLHYRLLTNNAAWIKDQIRQIARERRIDKAKAAVVYQQRADRTWAAARELAARAGTDLDEAIATAVEKVQAVRRIVNRDRDEEITVAEEEQCHTVIPGLDELTAIRLRTDAGQMIGLSVEPSHRRWYPYGSDACHVIGMTGKVWPEEMESLNIKADQAPWLERMRSNYLPGDTIGKVGVEKMCEQYLRGRRGYRRFRLSGETLREEPTVQGGDVHLTLDIVLQKQIAEMFEAKGFTGAAVVLNLGEPRAPMNEVLAMVSVPTYDLNDYARNYPSLVADEVRLPLMHRAIVQRYQPGSAVKPLAAIAALADGVITPATTIDCRGYMYNPDSFRCWLYKRFGHGHGPLNVTEGIQHSCNIFFYTIGQRLGTRRLCEWFCMFGLAEPPGTGLPSERAGTVPTEQWLRARSDRGYQPGDARFMAVGQGLLTVTPLHMAGAIATIARDGVFLSPTLALEGGPKQVRRDLPIVPAHLQAVKEGMYRVVNDRQGTAYKYFHGPGVTPVEGVDICGKTGTATTAPQRIDSNNNGRIDQDDQIVRSGDTAWFVGFAPRDNPQIALAVTVEYIGAGGGGANAAPIGLEIIRLCQKMGYIQ